MYFLIEVLAAWFCVFKFIILIVPGLLFKFENACTRERKERINFTLIKFKI